MGGKECDARSETQPSASKLVALFKGIKEEISMDSFDDKIRVQKIAYLAQTRGIDLGYKFQWYLRGPYCKQVSEDAHDISECAPSDLDIEKIKKFAEYIRSHTRDAQWLEIAASLIYLKNNHYKDYDIESVCGYLLDDLTYGYKNFATSSVQEILESLRKQDWLR